MPKREIIDCLRRTATLIWNNDGVLQKIHFLGLKRLPFQARGVEEGVRYNEGNYFLYLLSMPQSEVPKIRPEIKLDADVLRVAMCYANESRLPEDYECTLQEELLTPFFRPSVQPLLQDKNVLTTPRRVHAIQGRKVKLIG